MQDYRPCYTNIKYIDFIYIYIYIYAIGKYRKVMENSKEICNKVF